LQEALTLGVVIDETAILENVSDADFVIVSVPVDVALTVLPEWDLIGENTIVLKWVLLKLSYAKQSKPSKRRIYRNTSNCRN
jgi:prephenate dehydrogenase